MSKTADQAHQTTLDAFKQHLRATGKSAHTTENYSRRVRNFLGYVGDIPPERISEAQVTAYFARMKGNSKASRYNARMVIGQFLRFSTARLPVPVDARGAHPPGAAAPKKAVAIQARWNVDKLLEQKQTNEELIAKLARRVIDHYVFFQSLLKDGEVDLDTVNRFADDCRELIETNLPLFMALSASGLNVHSKIDERVQR